MAIYAKPPPVGLTPIQREDRRMAALEMMRGGAPLETIRAQLDYHTTDQAKRDLSDALISVVSASNEMSRALELSRLDGLVLTFWPAARRGDVQAADRILKIIETRAKLLGLYAPTRTEVVTMDAIESEIERLETEISKRS